MRRVLYRCAVTTLAQRWRLARSLLIRRPAIRGSVRTTIRCGQNQAPCLTVRPALSAQPWSMRQPRRLVLSRGRTRRLASARRLPIRYLTRLTSWQRPQAIRTAESTILLRIVFSLCRHRQAGTASSAASRQMDRSRSKSISTRRFRSTVPPKASRWTSRVISYGS